MIGRKFGRIVNIGSESGRIGEFKEAVYAGTKGAIMSFSKAVAREAGKYGITVNVVSPAMIAPESDEEMGELSMWRTDVLAVFTPEKRSQLAQTYPIRRMGTADEIADAVAFLVSERAGYITGQTLSVSGGYTMV